jgi:hypothetical protein
MVKEQYLGVHYIWICLSEEWEEEVIDNAQK